MGRTSTRWRLTVAVLLALTPSACGTDEAADDTATLSGTVTRGPVCSVEREDSPCPDESADVTLRFERAGAEVASVATGADGTYEVELEPGAYDVVIEGEQAGPGSTVEPASVTVNAGRTEQDFSIDTGIR